VRFLCALVPVLIFGCGDRGVPAGGDASSPPLDIVIAGPPRIELGGGLMRFEALPDGGTIELVLGPQGGWHLDLSARGENLPPEGLALRYEVRDDARSTAWNFPVTASLNARRVLPDGAGWVRVGDRAVLDIRAASEVLGRVVRVAVRAQRGEAVVAEDVRALRVVDDLRP